MTARVLFVGWDGADWALLDPLLEQGRLPNLRRLREGGRSGVLRSTFPWHSVAAWTSFLTGVPSEDHGVVDFNHAEAGRYFPTVPYTYASLPRPTLLDVLGEHGKRVFAGHIPMTFPPAPINGALISGVFLPPGRPFTHPPELQAELDALGGFPINGLQWAAAPDLDRLFAQARELVGRRADIFLHLLRRERWDVALVAFMAPDRLQHPGMHVLDPAHPRHDGLAERSRLTDGFHSVFEDLDEALGRLVHEAGADTVVLASDHGFRSTWVELDVNRLLEGLGYFRYRSGRARLRPMLRPVRRALRRTSLRRTLRGTMGEAAVDWARTLAYAPSAFSHGIRLNLVGREPAGAVGEDRAMGMLDRLVQDLGSARLPDGRPVFGRVTVHEGAGRRNAALPDLFLEPARGVAFTLGGRQVVQPTGRKTGDHRPEGIIVQVGDGPGSLPESIWELPRTLVAAAGVDPSTWPGGQSPGLEAPSQSEPTAEEQAAIQDHLRGLGYVE